MIEFKIHWDDGRCSIIQAGGWIDLFNHIAISELEHIDLIQKIR